MYRTIERKNRNIYLNWYWEKKRRREGRREGRKEGRKEN